jgi:hypothetical protein
VNLRLEPAVIQYFCVFTETNNLNDKKSIAPVLMDNFVLLFIYQKVSKCFFNFSRRFLMPCPFTGLKMFCASPNFLSQPQKIDCI